MSPRRRHPMRASQPRGVETTQAMGSSC